MNTSIAQVLIFQSEIYLSTNDYKKAKDNLDKASRISEEFDIPMMEARIFLAYGQLYSNQNKVDNALENLEEALDIFMDINNKLRASDVLIMMGFMYLKKNKLRKAIKSYKRAKKIIDKMDGAYMKNIAGLEKAIEEHEQD
tara:strand:+ start:418 stop:840 length:423 start_codon:yes stop_codon:yes gene_type:complete